MFIFYFRLIIPLHSNLKCRLVTASVLSFYLSTLSSFSDIIIIISFDIKGNMECENFQCPGCAMILDKCHSEYRHQCHGFRRLKCELFFFYCSQITAMGPIVLQFLPYIALFPILFFTFHRSLGDLCSPISLHIFQLLLIAYSGAAMHSLLTHAQSAYSCTVCLLMHSLLTHAQSAYSCTVCLLMHSMLSYAVAVQPHHSEQCT